MTDGTGKPGFAELVRQPDHRIDLGLGALLIAQEEYPELDCERWLARLDEMGEEARRRLKGCDEAPQVVASLSSYLAAELGFHGNRDDYYDPRNSFLNDVLERRTGIPITLSTLYIEVGRRAGAQVEGVGFPAHFLAKCIGGFGEEVIFDPFDDGAVLSIDACKARFAELSSGSSSWDDRYLESTPRKQILLRMLNNLKAIYLRSAYYRKALGIIDRLLLIDPAADSELRDRGMIHYQLKNFALASRDLGAYLKHCQQPEEAQAIRGALEKIRDIVKLIDE